MPRTTIGSIPTADQTTAIDFPVQVRPNVIG